MKLFLRGLCEMYGEEKITETMRELLKKIQAAGLDPREFIKAIAYFAGEFDPETKKVNDKLVCINIKELLGDEPLIVDKEPDLKLLSYWERLIMPTLFEVLGDERIYALAKYASKLAMSEYDYLMLLTGIETRWKKIAKHIEDFVALENLESGELVLILKYSSPEEAKRFAETGKAGPVTYAYATFKALANGYQGVKFKRIELISDTEVALTFEYIRFLVIISRLTRLIAINFFFTM